MPRAFGRMPTGAAGAVTATDAAPEKGCTAGTGDPFGPCSTPPQSGSALAGTSRTAATSCEPAPVAPTGRTFPNCFPCTWDRCRLWARLLGACTRSNGKARTPASASRQIPAPSSAGGPLGPAGSWRSAGASCQSCGVERNGEVAKSCLTTFLGTSSSRPGWPRVCTSLLLRFSPRGAGPGGPI